MLGRGHTWRCSKPSRWPLGKDPGLSHAVSSTPGSPSPPVLAHSAPNIKLPSLQQPGLPAMPQPEIQTVLGVLKAQLRAQLLHAGPRHPPHTGGDADGLG